MSAPFLFKKPTPNQINLIKNATNHFLLLKIFLKTESAQLCAGTPPGLKGYQIGPSLSRARTIYTFEALHWGDAGCWPRRVYNCTVYIVHCNTALVADGEETLETFCELFRKHYSSILACWHLIFELSKHMVPVQWLWKGKTQWKYGTKEPYLCGPSGVSLLV